MPSVRSSLLLEVSAFSWKIARYALLLCAISTTLTGAQRTKANKQAIESLAPRVKTLDELLCAPVPKGDTKEQESRKRLEQ